MNGLVNRNVVAKPAQGDTVSDSVGTRYKVHSVGLRWIYAQDKAGTLVSLPLSEVFKVFDGPVVEEQ
jgi:hypothetical protein